MSGGQISGISYDPNTGTAIVSVAGFTAKAKGSDFGLSCSVSAAGTLSGTYTNPGTLRVTGTVTLSNVSGLGCSLGGISNGSTGSVSGTYEITSPPGGVTVGAA